MRAAVIAAAGIGDGLMMLVAAHRLFENGYQVTLFQDTLPELASWFPYCRFANRTSLQNSLAKLDNYDLIVLQHDNRLLAQTITTQARQKKLSVTITFYPFYDPARHLALTKRDFVFDQRKTMVENIAISIAAYLPGSRIATDNGIAIPADLHYRAERRLLIHPTSTAPERTWSKKKFISLAKKLRRRFDLVFCMHPKERAEWMALGVDPNQLPRFPTLSELAAFVYESQGVIGNDSGVGHLASNLGIPTLIIAECAKHMAMWRPGWATTNVLTPPRWIPNTKGLRLRKKKWQAFISPHRVHQAILNNAVDLLRTTK
ncbi:MAG: glycosyltransferase family 9 protein [Chlamydiota bacterium]